MTSAEANEAIRATEVGYKMKFKLSDFTTVSLRIENNRYVLTLSGLTEEAYVKGVLGLDVDAMGQVAFEMAKEMFGFSPENYSVTYIVWGSGELYSLESSTAYTFFATEENAGYEGTLEYVIKESVTTYMGAAIPGAPSDADQYIEMNDK